MSWQLSSLYPRVRKEGFRRSSVITHAALLALSIPSKFKIEIELCCNVNTHNQQAPHQILFLQLLKQLVAICTTKDESLLEAVMMILPPLVLFPLDSLDTIIAAEASLTARKHLR